jgi:nicotinate phosphoribosyltransferase
MSGKSKTELPKSGPPKSGQKEKLERQLEEGLEGTFPASDPISVTDPAPDHSPAKKKTKPLAR